MQPLKSNDKVYIVAPGAGSPLPAGLAENWQDLQICCEQLRAWNLQPIFSDTIFGVHPAYYNFANAHAARALDFIAALESDANMIWSYRGGYGSDRVLQSLIQNKVARPKQPKLIVGFSDITIIHSYVLNHWQWPSLHALSLRQCGLRLVNEKTIELTRQIIFGELNHIRVPLTPLNDAAKKNKTLSAPVTGGNLTMLQCSFGTPWQLNLNKYILLLEEVNESPYRVARIFYQMLNNHFLDKVQAIIIGDFIATENCDTAIQEFADSCPIPVLRCSGVGHSTNNLPIPFGTEAQIKLAHDAHIFIPSPFSQYS